VTAPLTFSYEDRVALATNLRVQGTVRAVRERSGVGVEWDDGTTTITRARDLVHVVPEARS
jgi:hypothetical protein